MVISDFSVMTLQSGEMASNLGRGGRRYPAIQVGLFVTLDNLLIAKSLVTSPSWVLLECSTDPAHFDLMA